MTGVLRVFNQSTYHVADDCKVVYLDWPGHRQDLKGDFVAGDPTVQLVPARHRGIVRALVLQDIRGSVKPSSHLLSRYSYQIGAVSDLIQIV